MEVESQAASIGTKNKIESPLGSLLNKTSEAHDELLQEPPHIYTTL